MTDVTLEEFACGGQLEHVASDWGFTGFLQSIDQSDAQNVKKQDLALRRMRAFFAGQVRGSGSGLYF